MHQFDEIQSHLSPELTQMNEIIRETLFTPNQLMNQVVTGYLQTKGKQIRPLLVLLSAKFFGGVTSDTLYAAAALEMLHNASLIHDDVVDETTLRRGSATVNALWGNHLAVLVGDFFVSNALAAGIRTGHIDVISALSDLGKELSLGEVDQICNVREHHFDEKRYIDMIRKKTASLFMNCVKLGAVTAGATESEYAPMVEYAELLGLSFQIRDDIFDYYSDESAIGKPTGNDLREGKVTLPLIYALGVCPKEKGEECMALLRRGNLTHEEIAWLVALAREYGGVEYSYSYMRRLQKEAQLLLSRYPESEWRDRFERLFDFIITRSK
ncbi:MAG: polyprenyl synthetase family protein [Muribaculaceae bacterium]|nr:polyprenyl synthetase family protein [Muribaculaceae bacterium]